MKTSTPVNDDIFEAEWPITTNLEHALRYLRHDSVERVLWIDAICIDQSNIEERNHQVPFMKAIYSNALAVSVGLGSPTPGSDDAIKILKEMGRGVPIQDIRLHDHLIDDNNLRSVVELNRRPWWYRTWVQQEFVLAKKAFIHCGLKFLERDELLSMLGLFDAIESATKSLRFARSITNELFNSFYVWARIDYTMIVARNPQSTDENLIKMLSVGWLCHNSDEHDSIYGFLGLLSENIASKIVPDYSISAADVFRDVAIQLTILLQSFFIFSLIQYTENKNRRMPTWVPSWHALSGPELIEDWTYTSNRLVQHTRFSCCGKRTMRFQVHKSNVLKVSGARFDSTSSRGEFMKLFKAETDWIFGQIQKWQLLCFTDEVQAQSLYVAGGKKTEAFWRTLVNDMLADKITSPRRCKSKDHQSYLEWLDEFENTTTAYWESENANHFQTFFYDACYNRRFFITKKGYFGIGPTELEEGDEIYILAGGKRPFALRRLLGAGPNTFELIGDCYVHGIMDGEAASKNMPSRVFENVTVGETYDAQESDPDLPLRDFHDVFHRVSRGWENLEHFVVVEHGIN